MLPPKLTSIHTSSIQSTAPYNSNTSTRTTNFYNGGIMPSKWIHLYSIPKNERTSSNWKCSIKKKEIISLRDLLYGKSIIINSIKS